MLRSLSGSNNGSLPQIFLRPNDVDYYLRIAQKKVSASDASSSRPGRRIKANRLRHLLTICRGVSKRVAMTSLDNPWAAKRMTLARITSRYGDVYLRVRISSFSCSLDVSTMRNGLERDNAVPS